MSLALRRRGWIIAGAILALGLVAWAAAAPLLTFKALSEAARYGQPARLESMVDFPALRESLKVQLAQRLSAAIQDDRRLNDSPFGALGALLAPSLVDQMVDAVVTPAGISAIVVTGRAPLPDPDPRQSALPPPPETAPPPARASEPATRFAYRGFDTFVAVTRAKGADPIGWVLERRNLVQWKLVAIELPPR